MLNYCLSSPHFTFPPVFSPHFAHDEPKSSSSGLLEEILPTLLPTLIPHPDTPPYSSSSSYRSSPLQASEDVDIDVQPSPSSNDLHQHAIASTSKAEPIHKQRQNENADEDAEAETQVTTFTYWPDHLRSSGAGSYAGSQEEHTANGLNSTAAATAHQLTVHLLPKRAGKEMIVDVTKKLALEGGKINRERVDRMIRGEWRTNHFLFEGRIRQEPSLDSSTPGTFFQSQSSQVVNYCYTLLIIASILVFFSCFVLPSCPLLINKSKNCSHRLQTPA